MNSIPRLHSTCPHDCPSTCALEVERLDENTIGRVYGSKHNPYTAGTICAKVARYAERVHHPDRLQTPLRRVGNKGDKSAFKPITWNEALDETANQLNLAEQKYGSETVWPHFYAGTMGLVQRDGIERFRHAKKYSRQFSTICTALADAGWMAGTGIKRGVDGREIAESDLIVVWGGNPVNTQVNVMHHIAQAKRKRNANLVVVDPYRTGTAEKAHIHLMPKPGTDGALACAVMHVLFAEGYANWDYLNSYTDVPEELSRHVTTLTPEWAQEISGVDADQIIEFAHLYGKTKRSYIRVGYGFSRSRNGAANVHAVSCLPAITGAWKYKGGGALYSNNALYPIDATLIQGLDVLDKSTRVFDQSRIGPILCNDPQDIGDGPPVTALFIQNTNPIAVSPDSNKVKQGFMRDDLFVCVHEQFMTETAAVADIVLPATTFLEHDDMYQAGGHTFLQVTKKVIEPFAQSRPNHWVICELAKRLGVEHPGFNLNEWELMDATLKISGLPDADTIYENHWHDCSLDFDDMHFLNGFETPDKKFHFKPDWSRVGKCPEPMPELPGHMNCIDQTNDDYPFRLVTAPARNFLNTSFTETPTSQKNEKQPEVLIHPDDLKRLKLNENDRVNVGSTVGEVIVRAKSFDGLQPGVLVVESIWPNDAFENGVGINSLISADAGFPRGGAVFHDTAVWLKPAS